jgi:hypothetical protein
MWIHPNDATTIRGNNQGTITLTKDGSLYVHSKHINVKYHYICEHIAASDVAFHYLPTAEMTADVLTKALSRPKHAKFTEKMGLKGYDGKEWFSLFHRGGVLKWRQHGATRGAYGRAEAKPLSSVVLLHTIILYHSLFMPVSNTVIGNISVILLQCLKNKSLTLS